jgi:hypothetical protein
MRGPSMYESSLPLSCTNLYSMLEDICGCCIVQGVMVSCMSQGGCNRPVPGRFRLFHKSRCGVVRVISGSVCHKPMTRVRAHVAAGVTNGVSCEGIRVSRAGPAVDYATFSGVESQMCGNGENSVTFGENSLNQRSSTGAGPLSVVLCRQAPYKSSNYCTCQ